VANGFVVVSDGNITLGQQSLSRINASMLFDFDRLELQRLEARVGSDGTLSGAGSIGLFQEKVGGESTHLCAYDGQDPSGDCALSGRWNLDCQRGLGTAVDWRLNSPCPMD
jgi:hypothetical protein